MPSCNCGDDGDELFNWKSIVAVCAMSVGISWAGAYSSKGDAEVKKLEQRIEALEAGQKIEKAP